MFFTKNLTSIIPLALVVVGLLGYNFISAQWVGPTATAPGNNARAPINVGTSTQSLQDAYGALVFNRFAALNAVWSPLYCDGNGLNCRSITAMGGGGGITQLSSGNGIILSPTTITSTGTISINPAYTQRRITGTCPAGQAIRGINADGTVICQASAATCLWKGLEYSQGARCRTGALSCFVTGTYGHAYQTCGSDGTWNLGSTGCSLSPGSTPSCP